jgi:DNA replication protein DnaC
LSEHLNVLVTGGTGAGKSLLACALAQSAAARACACSSAACLVYSTNALARADGSHARLLSKLAKFDLLVLDDWGLGTPKES